MKLGLLAVVSGKILALTYNLWQDILTKLRICATIEIWGIHPIVT